MIMNRIFSTIFATSVLSLVVAPNAHAIRPELIPKYSQLPEGVEQTKPMQSQIMESQTMQNQMMPPKPEPSVNAEPQLMQPGQQSVEPENSFRSFERFYRDRFGY